MINSLDTEKSFWQNPTSHHDENPGETRGERGIPQHNKGKPTANAIIYKQILILFSLRYETTPRCPFSLPIQYIQYGS